MFLDDGDQPIEDGHNDPDAEDPRHRPCIVCIGNAVLNVVPDWEVNIIISFEPMRDPSMIKDPDLQKMFL